MIGETMVCPKCGYIANHDSYFGAMVCRQCGWMRYNKPTNADRIRSMSDEELAKFIEDLPIDKACHRGLCFDGETCEKCKLNWLRQPAEG